MKLLFDEENTSRVRQNYNDKNSYDKYEIKYRNFEKRRFKENEDIEVSDKDGSYYTNVNEYLDSKGYFNPDNMSKKDKNRAENSFDNKSEESNLYSMGEDVVSSQVLRAITEIGFTSFTPIQQQAIPVVMSGTDIIGQAQTGTGKTAAFGIPLIQKINPKDDSVQGLVLCPTRELAIQAADEIRKFAKYMHGVKVVPIYGGADINRQIRALKAKVSIVVGTPGRVMDHMRRHTLKLGALKMLVLDEADEMLNMGFRDDIETILKEIPSEHQTALFSATMPPAILEITKTYLKEDAKLIKVTKKELTMPSIKQYYYEVNIHNKNEVTARLLDYYDPKLTLIFCNTKTMVDKLCDYLKEKGYKAEGLHGDLSQYQRDKVMKGFRDGTTKILIATDVAARGIDVDDVEAVINYDIPQDIEYYVHRIGRTGRAGRKGRACTLVVGKEIFKIREIEKICKTKMVVREVPSVKDVKGAKATKVFEQINKIIDEEDLSGILPLLEKKLEESGNTAISIAAALLKSHMGEEPKEIVIEKFVPRKPKYGRGFSDYRDDRNQRGRSYRGRNNDGKSYGNRTGEKSFGNRNDMEKSYGSKAYGNSRIKFDDRRDSKNYKNQKENAKDNHSNRDGRNRNKEAGKKRRTSKAD